MRRLAPVCAAALLAACGALDRAHPPAPVQAAGESAGGRPEDLVAYVASLRGLNERALAAEVARQRQAARRDAAAIAQLKAAIALALVPQSDEAEILALVEPLARRPGADAEVRGMASFLLVQAAERRRLRESAAAAGNRLREERRAAEAQKQRADALQERAGQLQQKLDALTEIEKSLSDRQGQNR